MKDTNQGKGTFIWIIGSYFPIISIFNIMLSWNSFFSWISYSRWFNCLLFLHWWNKRSNTLLWDFESIVIRSSPFCICKDIKAFTSKKINRDRLFREEKLSSKHINVLKFYKQPDFNGYLNYDPREAKATHYRR